MVHIARAIKETQRSSRTSKNEGYAANVHAAQTNAIIFTKMQQDHALALANLATATQSNRILVALIMKRISELLIQIPNLTSKLVTTQIENARLKNSGHHSTPSEHGHWASRNLTPSDPNSSQEQNVFSKSGQKFDPNEYCCSHGYKVEEAHTCKTCCFPNNVHNKLAKRLEIKVGKTWNKEWINSGPNTRGGEGLDEDKVNINENYIN